MSGFFISAQRGYYEGDRDHELDLEVPRRPAPGATWDGEHWIPGADPSLAPANAAAFDARQRDQALQDLDRLISSSPAEQQPALRVIQELLKD